AALLTSVSNVFVWAISQFLFSSRRRHTRWPRDWSSDVCSSHLSYRSKVAALRGEPESVSTDSSAACTLDGASGAFAFSEGRTRRSEERRVGKGWRVRRAV